jgi:hypothetical protein
MQEYVYPVVAGRMPGVSEHAVAEQIGERGERAIEAVLDGRPPVGVLEDRRKIPEAQRAQARVVENEDLVVEDKGAAERVGVSEENERDETDGGIPSVPAGRRKRARGNGRGGRCAPIIPTGNSAPPW